MITMLLVEDESFERRSLANCVDWELIGVRIAGEAANGSQGLALALEIRPDIVLTDVKMPVMSGIEMSRRIRQAMPEVKILFLSSYDDFEYAKQAIDLSISAYLMKPVNEIELLRAVKKIADEINTNRLEQQLLSKRQENFAASRSLARQALVSRALSGMHVEETDARTLGLEWLFFAEQAFAIALCVYEPGTLASIDALLERLNLRCQKISAHAVSICMNEGHLVTLCALKKAKDPETLDRLTATLHDFMKEQGAANARVELATGRNVARLYAHLLRQRLTGALPAPGDKKKKNKEQIVHEIQQIISQQYQNPITLESISRELHFTPNYVGASFKSVAKISVNRYLLQVRLEKAKEELLRGKSLPLGVIAERCGFGSNTYFHTSFKKETGMTPSEYRHRAAKGGGAEDGPA